jgi:hypothetical protein
MNQSNIITLSVSKVLLFGYAIDLTIYHSSLLQSKSSVLLVLILIGSGISFIINYQLFKITKRENVISLFITIIIAVLIKLFTIGDPIFEAVNIVVQNKQMAFSIILGGVSLILFETISLQLIPERKRKKLGFKTQILDDFGPTS